MMADCLDLTIDEVAFECELGACTEDVDLGWWKLSKGSVGGSLAKFKGMSDGEPKIEVHLEWQMTPSTEPRWKVQGCYITTIEGDPMIINRHMILPATGMPHGLMDADYFASLGMTITGMPALNAMRSVCDAKPGPPDQRRPPTAGLRQPVPGLYQAETALAETTGEPRERALSVPGLTQRLVQRRRRCGPRPRRGEAGEVPGSGSGAVSGRGRTTHASSMPTAPISVPISASEDGCAVTASPVPFHGWRFDGEGRLVEVPRLDRATAGFGPCLAGAASATGGSSSGTTPKARPRATTSSATETTRRAGRHGGATPTGYGCTSRT